MRSLFYLPVMRVLFYLAFALFTYLGQSIIVKLLEVGLNPIQAYWGSYLGVFLGLILGIYQLIKIDKKWLTLIGMALIAIAIPLNHPIYINDFHAYDGHELEANEELQSAFAEVLSDSSFTGVVGLYSTTCRYCAQYLEWINSTSDITLPYTQVIGGSDSTLSLLKENIDLNYPVIRTMDNKLFTVLSRGSIPKFYYLENGVPTTMYDSRSFNFKSIRQMQLGQKPESK